MTLNNVTLQVWDVVLVDFRFSEDPTVSKQRPAVIREIRNDDSIVLYVTTKDKPHKLKVELDYKACSLDKPSFVHVGRRQLIKLDSVKYIGTLTDEDVIKIRGIEESILLKANL